MGLGSPENFTVKQIDSLVLRLQDAADEVAGFARSMEAEGIETIRIQNSAAYDRLLAELKRWKRSAEDALDDARRPTEATPKSRKKIAKTKR